MKYIKLDIDDELIDWQRIETVAAFFRHLSGYKECVVEMRNGKVSSRGLLHHHITIEINDGAPDFLIPFVQLALCSDYKREMVNASRLFSKIPFHMQNILFEENYKENPKATQRLNQLLKRIEQY